MLLLLLLLLLLKGGNRGQGLKFDLKFLARWVVLGKIPTRNTRSCWGKAGEKNGRCAQRSFACIYFSNYLLPAAESFCRCGTLLIVEMVCILLFAV